MIFDDEIFGLFEAPPLLAAPPCTLDGDETLPNIMARLLASPLAEKAIGLISAMRSPHHMMPMTRAAATWQTIAATPSFVLGPHGRARRPHCCC